MNLSAFSYPWAKFGRFSGCGENFDVGFSDDGIDAESDSAGDVDVYNEMDYIAKCLATGDIYATARLPLQEDLSSSSTLAISSTLSRFR